MDAMRSGGNKKTKWRRQGDENKNRVSNATSCPARRRMSDSPTSFIPYAKNGEMAMVVGPNLDEGLWDMSKLATCEWLRHADTSTHRQ